MSRLAKFVFGSACVGTCGIIGYVHMKQYIDRQYLHEGIVKDLERQQKKKTENLYNLQNQIDITKRYKEVTKSRPSESATSASTPTHVNTNDTLTDTTNTKNCLPPEHLNESWFEQNSSAYIVPPLSGTLEMSRNL